MKYLCITMISIATFSASAQQGTVTKDLEFSPDQIATIKTKRMSLALDLNASQQQKIQELHLEHAKFRMQKRAEIKQNKTNNIKRSSEERFQILDKALDHRIAQKLEMKRILDKDQYRKWEQINRRMALKRKHTKRKQMMKRKRIHKAFKRH